MVCEILRARRAMQKWPFFFFAGHGAQVGGSNYLIPVGGSIQSETDVPDEALDAASVLRRLEDARIKVALVILDACRDNPYAGASRSASRGLGRMNVPTGTIVAYATAPGSTAADGSGNNGVYTEQLVRQLKTPNLDIKEVFDRTAQEVERITNGKQRPREEIGLRGRFVLKGSNNPSDGVQVASIRPEPVQQAALPAIVVQPEPQRPVTTASGQILKDCAQCPEMVLISSGSFDMGSNTANSDEKPVHRVSIRSFLMGKTEVTQGQWKAVMGTNPSQFSNCGDDCPVENVGWSDAHSYAQKLSQQTGKSYRLPSEAEWEYACRAGGSQTYCGSDDVNTVGWHNANSDRKTHSVAGKQANAFGLYDMSGNVWEWVEDVWYADYSGAPSDGSAWNSGGDQSQRVLRGGSWFNYPGFLRSAVRIGISPVGRNSSFNGFRIARTL